jgi:hypothetical protein
MALSKVLIDGEWQMVADGLGSPTPPVPTPQATYFYDLGKGTAISKIDGRKVVSFIENAPYAAA